ncbi:uncharacterized protein DSM5745_06119 [Aspergillus mulundensis]|uniref:Uncharacterized protein n=1 Tax=Aspergillus mulundensis TaxID=1810919 RepID=A0A3D8RYY2_9EURO|nr:hypothetical protein DSM5745_06119 [Aspergillus mulundensis]RDW79267.1 hypothetical protein DSM5745_06119 [Aspergillus mulundensis]
MTDTVPESPIGSGPSSLTSLLENAAASNNVDEIEKLLKRVSEGTEFRQCLEAGLASSARHGHIEAIKCILDEGKDVMTPDDLVFPLLLSVAGGFGEIVQLLLDSGAPVDGTVRGRRELNNSTAVSLAARRNNAQVLEILLAHGADINAKDSAQRILLHTLADEDNWDDNDARVLDLIFQYTHDVHSMDKYGITPLHTACYGGKLDLVRRLLKRHQDLESSPAALGFVRRGALEVAIKRCWSEIVEVLLTMGADPNATLESGSLLLLHSACRHSTEDIVSLLLKNGANINHRARGVTPLVLAIQSGRTSVVRVLLEREELELRDSFGDHAFFEAAAHRDIMKVLLPSPRAGSRAIDDISFNNKFLASIVSFDENSIGHLRLPISQILSIGLGTEWILENKKADAPRWIHIPANNPTWVETLLMKWTLLMEGDAAADDTRRLCNLIRHPHRGQYPHSQFHRPGCQVIGNQMWACMPYLHFETTEGYQKMRNAIRRAETTSFPSEPYRSSYDELLIEAYPALSPGGLHIRRTLDQFFYPNLDTEYRDEDQVVYRYQVRTQCPVPKIYMVDQLWMIILKGGLVITTFPQRLEQPENDRFDVFDRIMKHLKQKRIRKLDDLVTAIVDQCCGAFDRHAPSNDEEYQFFAMFEASIGRVAMTERKLFDQLRKASKKASLWLQTHRENMQSFGLAHHSKRGKDHDAQKDNSPGFVDDFLDYSPETSLLFEVQDIRDEIDMIRAVLNHQRRLLPNLGAGILELYNKEVIVRDRETSNKQVTFPEQDRVVNMYLEDLDRMDRQAAHLYESISSLLDLKQKHANPFEARLAREQAADTARQGKTIMIFTIVTIVFLPLSFITSFFTINIAEFPQTAGSDSLSLSFVSKYIFGVGLAIAIPLILLAFAAQDFKLGFQTLQNLLRGQGVTKPSPTTSDDKVNALSTPSDHVRRSIFSRVRRREPHSRTPRTQEGDVERGPAMYIVGS